MGIPNDWQSIFEIAGFSHDGFNQDHWKRQIAELVRVDATYHPDQDKMAFQLYPSIGGHSVEEHVINATSAAVMFKVAMTLAERSNGQVMQEALMGECMSLNEHGSQTRLLASYPEMPLTFDRLCVRFQRVLARGIEQGEKA